MTAAKRATVPIFCKPWIIVAVAVSVWPLEVARFLGVV